MTVFKCDACGKEAHGMMGKAAALPLNMNNPWKILELCQACTNNMFTYLSTLKETP